MVKLQIVKDDAEASEKKQLTIFMVMVDNYSICVGFEHLIIFLLLFIFKF